MSNLGELAKRCACGHFRLFHHAGTDTSCNARMECECERFEESAPAEPAKPSLEDVAREWRKENRQRFMFESPVWRVEMLDEDAMLTAFHLYAKERGV